MTEFYANPTEWDAVSNILQVAPTSLIRALDTFQGNVEYVAENREAQSNNEQLLRVQEFNRDKVATSFSHCEVDISETFTVMQVT